MIKLNLNILRFLIIVFFSFVFRNTLIGQDFSPYFTQQQYFKYIEYLLNNGDLKVNHPLSQPYSTDLLLEKLPENDLIHWNKLLRKDLKKYSSSDSVNEYGKLIAGGDVSDKVLNFQNDFKNNISGSLFAGYSFQNIGLFYKHSFDQAYGDDTSYFGSTGKITDKVYGRASEAYLQWNLKNLCFFMGRLNRNYGLMNEYSLILSDNTYSYDHIGLSFDTKFLKYSFMLTRLNDIYGYDIRDSIPDYSWNRRFLSMHRFEISILKNLEFAFTESILFGGKDQSIRFQYINPVSIFFFNKMSDRKSYEEGNANAYMSFELYYKPIKKLTLYGQFLIDDMDFKKDLREIYPDRIGYLAKVIYTDLLPASQIYIKYNRISNWTYNSFYTWGNYTFHDRSLGYPKNGVENISLGIDCFNFSPFIIGLVFKAERERKQDLTSPFIPKKTGFPIGISQSAISSTVIITCFATTYLIADANFEYISYNNFQNINGNDKDFFNFYISLKIVGVFELFNR